MTKIANNKLAREKAEKIGKNPHNIKRVTQQQPMLLAGLNDWRKIEKIGKKPTQYKTRYTVVADVVGWID